MIEEDRDAGFWRDVFEHPAVHPHVALGHEIDLAAVVASERVTPLRSANGGFLFIQLDGIGRVHELHTLFKPEGWGREVYLAATEAFAAIFARGSQVITTYEVAGNKRSRPPKTFGFEPAGEFAACADLDAELRTWVLTRLAWIGSPACKRMIECP